jgi:RecB family exonuclease
VSQALERIRRIARERKKERFTTLFHHLSISLMHEYARLLDLSEEEIARINAEAAAAVERQIAAERRAV